VSDLIGGLLVEYPDHTTDAVDAAGAEEHIHVSALVPRI
jgi:hypothetical protein